MQSFNFNISAKSLGKFDVAVCGGGIAGSCAAISAARAGAEVVLIEKAGSLGGTLTEGFMPIILDSVNKGGIVRELFSFLEEHNMCCARHGSPTDENGKLIPGIMVDTEGCKYFFERECAKAGVKLLYHSQVSSLNIDDGKIDSLLITTECGNYSLSADIYIDSTGNGSVAAMAGCEWDIGDPMEKRPSPASMGLCVVGMPPEYNGAENADEKTAYNDMLKSHGITISAGQFSVRKLPSLKTWTVGLNFEYDVMPDDIIRLSDAIVDGRREIFEVIEEHKKIDNYSELCTAFTNSHIGIREGRRIYGEYRITDEDILEGRRFDDGICLVTFGVDVHKLKSDDTTECKRGYRAIPYNIPYRALVARDCDNLLLAGRCISGDFYPHASYRVMGNMAATGEAAGFAASLCINNSAEPKSIDGKLVSDFMKKQNYEI